MMKITKIVLTILLFTGVQRNVDAQVDPHFSQYYMHPLWLNPALTGAIDGNYRVAVIHRNQWSSITNAFSTIGLSGDIVTDKNINLGMELLQQSAGNAGYKYTNAQLSIAYTGVRFGREGDKVVTFGMQAGLLGRRFDLTGVQTDNQFLNGSYDPNLPTQLAITKPSASAFDMGVGVIFYDAEKDKKVNLFGGFSAAHINQPKDPSLSAGYESTLPVRYTLHGGVNIYLSDKAHFVPNVLVMQQGNTKETMLGGYVQMSVNGSTDITGGVNYRIEDAIYPYIGLSFSDFTFGLSYDVNTTQLGKLVKGTSSFELSLMYMDNKRQKGFFKCPRF